MNNDNRFFTMRKSGFQIPLIVAFIGQFYTRQYMFSRKTTRYTPVITPER